KAACTAGPRFSICLSAWAGARPTTCTASRRGAAYQRTVAKGNSALVSSCWRLSAKASPRVRSALGGSSSVPISTRKFCSAMPLSFFFAHGETQGFAGSVVGFGDGLGQGADAQYVALAFGH